MTADLDLRCQNFTFKDGLMYQCVNVVPDETAMGDGFFQTPQGGHVWVCEHHRFLDLTNGGMDIY